MDMWHEMRHAGVEMNTVVYNAVIDAQARVGLMDEVSLLVRSMEPDGCTPDVITYSTIVKGYCVGGDLEAAFEVFRNMQKNNMAKDSVVYNTLLDGCTRHSRNDLADEVLADMERLNVMPSNFTLGIVVKMYGRRRQLGKAFEAFEEIPRRNGFQPNQQVRTCLMSACLNNASPERAMEVFQGLKATGGADSKVYASMISGCARHGAFEASVGLAEEAYGLAPGASVLVHDGEPLENLMNALKRHGLVESIGLPLVERLRASGHVSGRMLSSVLGEVSNAAANGAVDKGGRGGKGYAKGSGTNKARHS
jgi:pentatricopeptide repeat protein